MQLHIMSSSLFFFLTLYGILLLNLLLSVPLLVSAVKVGNETDKLSLLEFKSQITDDPLGVLATWNDSLQLCKWVGVTCGVSHPRVTSLDLKDRMFVGTISPHIGNLSFLQSTNLANNSFYGGILLEFGHLIRLRNLNLSYNSLDGGLPANPSHCSNLVSLDLEYNHLVQQIPFELGFLSKLVTLSLNNNNLTGRLPASLGNLSSLQKLSLTYNNLEGEIPDTVAQMPSLKIFQVGVNHLSGVFPPALYNLSALEAISLAENHFYGNLRPTIGLSFPNLQRLTLGENQFTGPIPASLSNASKFQFLDIPSNNFTGNVPMSFGNMKDLDWLSVRNNSLGKYAVDDLSFLASLTNCSKLSGLDFGYNHYGGELPTSITNLSTQMSWLTLGGNRIGGTIPTGIANLVNLTNLCMRSNLLTGSIPASVGTLSKLSGLSLDGNQLTGPIPSSFGKLTQLSELYLYSNSLEGNIPAILGNCQSLREVDLSHNKFIGTIPIQLIGLSSLSVILNLSDNSLTGFLPPEVGNLKNLVALDISNNKLSGAIPSTLGSCMALEQLYMQGNFFQGTIPYLNELKGMKYLDLSRNNLSGQIPEYLASLHTLQNLNLSFNNLEGKVPEQGVFTNASALEVYGNANLCGGIQELQLRACSVQRSKKPRKHNSLKLILVIVSVTLFMALVVSSISLCWIRKSTKPLSTPSFGPFYPKVSYEELLNATARFSLGNLIGMGNFGTVYKGILGPDETAVAVKLLNLKQQGASKSFMAECQALRNIRHRNLVKVLTACSSSDFEGNDFKALVYEFMQNGSLEMWLHPEDEWKQLRILTFLQRINIAIDVASALHYLHHHCQTPVIHCDLKPSNVLLDNDLTAHVSDFGLARLLSKSSKDATLNQFSSLGIKGTIGYAAPEYGLGGQVSTQGDLYSYGILLLEIFTGRRPTDELFKDDLNLHKFAKMALPGRVMVIVDQSILHGNIGAAENNIESLSSWTSEQIECLISVLEVGVNCSAESPRDRKNTREVTLELLSIRDKFLGIEMHEEEVHSPVNRSSSFLEAI